MEQGRCPIKRNQLCKKKGKLAAQTGRLVRKRGQLRQNDFEMQTEGSGSNLSSTNEQTTAADQSLDLVVTKQYHMSNKNLHVQVRPGTDLKTDTTYKECNKNSNYTFAAPKSPQPLNLVIKKRSPPSNKCLEMKSNSADFKTQTTYIACNIDSNCSFTTSITTPISTPKPCQSMDFTISNPSPQPNKNLETESNGSDSKTHTTYIGCNIYDSNGSFSTPQSLPLVDIVIENPSPQFNKKIEMEMIGSDQETSKTDSGIHIVSDCSTDELESPQPLDLVVKKTDLTSPKNYENDSPADSKSKADNGSQTVSIVARNDYVESEIPQNLDGGYNNISIDTQNSQNELIHNSDYGSHNVSVQNSDYGYNNFYYGHNKVSVDTQQAVTKYILPQISNYGCSNVYYGCNNLSVDLQAALANSVFPQISNYGCNNVYLGYNNLQLETQNILGNSLFPPISNYGYNYLSLNTQNNLANAVLPPIPNYEQSYLPLGAQNILANSVFPSISNYGYNYLPVDTQNALNKSLLPHISNYGYCNVSADTHTTLANSEVHEINNSRKRKAPRQPKKTIIKENDNLIEKIPKSYSVHSRSKSTQPLHPVRKKRGCQSKYIASFEISSNLSNSSDFSASYSQLCTGSSQDYTSSSYLGPSYTNVVASSSILGESSLNLCASSDIHLGTSSANLVAISSSLRTSPSNLERSSNLIASPSSLIANSSNLVANSSDFCASSTNLCARSSNLDTIFSNIVSNSSNLVASSLNLNVISSNLGESSLNLGASLSNVDEGSSKLHAKKKRRPLTAEEKRLKSVHDEFVRRKRVIDNFKYLVDCIPSLREQKRTMTKVEILNTAVNEVNYLKETEIFQETEITSLEHEQEQLKMAKHNLLNLNKI